MKSRYVKFLAAVTLAICGVLPAAAQTNLVDLGVATGYAINNAGQVALSTGIYSSGTVTPLPALPGATTPAVPQAINASGQVAGYASVAASGSGLGCGFAIEYSAGTLTNLIGSSTCIGSLEAEFSGAVGINASGTIIGTEGSEDDHGEDTPFTYSNGVLTDMNLPCGISDAGVFTTKLCPPSANYFGTGANGINDAGDMVGTISWTNDSTRYAFLAIKGVWTSLGAGTAYAINASDEVTGTLYDSATNSPTHAFLYKDGTITNLGRLPGGSLSTGYAINTTGQIVGSSEFSATSHATHAFFYNGVMDDLNNLISATDPLKPYVTLTSAVGINDSLLILANGVDSRTNLTHAYLFQASYLALAPASLNFTQAVGGTSSPLTVTVTNTGTAAIPLSATSVNGNFSLVVDNCPASLAAGAQCKIEVVFVPKVLGVFTGTLTLRSGTNSYQVPLSGVGGIAATISASSGTATVGQPLTLTWAATSGSTCIARARSTNSNWTTSTPAFNGTIQASGKQTLTETLAGTMNYFLECSAPDVPAVVVSTQVVWNWPPVTVTISASPTTITAGQVATLTWTSSNATSCTATGGGPNDTWPGTKATSGSEAVTEAVALSVPSVLTFGISCSSTTSGLSDQASATVTDNPPARSGGGGALNPLSLAALAGIIALRRARLRINRARPAL